MGSEGSGGFAQPAIPKYDGDYDHWSMIMENLLRSKEYWTVVKDGITEPEAGVTMMAAQSKVLDELKLKDLMAKNYLFQSIDRSILMTMTRKETSKQLWESMRMKCQGNARVQRAQLNRLRKDFEVLSMKQGEYVNAYFGRVMIIANDMRIYGEEMPDIKIVEKILRTLTEKWNYIVCSIEESKDIDSLSVDALQSLLLVHEQKFRKENGEEQALAVTVNETYGGRGRGRYGASRGGRGCSNHMCGDSSSFNNFGFNRMVRLGNHAHITVTGKGSVRLCSQGVNHLVEDVFYVPDLENNLLSVGQLQEKRLVVLIEHNQCKLYHPIKGLIIQSNMTANQMFVLFSRRQECNQELCLQSNTQSLAQLWHCRYGHLSYTKLKMLKQKEMVHGLPSFTKTEPVCSGCLKGKHHRDVIPKQASWRASTRLELIRADIC